MRPFITLMTSTEMQDKLGHELDDDEMEDLQAFRDTVQEEFRQHLDAVSVMEELYGEPWKARDMRAWFVEDNGTTFSISSPILINEDTAEEALFRLLQMLAENLVRQNYPDSDLVENTYDKLDAVAGALALESLEQVMDDDRLTEVVEDARSDSEHLKMWRKIDEIREEWDSDETELFNWLEEQ